MSLCAARIRIKNPRTEPQIIQPAKDPKPFEPRPPHSTIGRESGVARESEKRKKGKGGETEGRERNEKEEREQLFFVPGEGGRISSHPPSLPPSLPRFLSPSLARSLPRSLSSSLPRFLAPSLPRSLAPSLPLSLSRVNLLAAGSLCSPASCLCSGALLEPAAVPEASA